MMTKRVIEKTITLDTTQYQDYELLQAFTQQAKREAWSEEEIDAVVTSAIDNHFEHFIDVISIHCTKPEY